MLLKADGACLTRLENDHWSILVAGAKREDARVSPPESSSLPAAAASSRRVACPFFPSGGVLRLKIQKRTIVVRRAVYVGGSVDSLGSLWARK